MSLYIFAGCRAGPKPLTYVSTVAYVIAYLQEASHRSFPITALSSQGDVSSVGLTTGTQRPRKCRYTDPHGVYSDIQARVCGSFREVTSFFTGAWSNCRKIFRSCLNFVVSLPFRFVPWNPAKDSPNFVFAGNSMHGVLMKIMRFCI